MRWQKWLVEHSLGAAAMPYIRFPKEASDYWLIVLQLLQIRTLWKMHGEVLLGTLVDTFLPELQEGAENPTRPCSAARKGPCTEQERVCVCVCVFVLYLVWQGIEKRSLVKMICHEIGEAHVSLILKAVHQGAEEPHTPLTMKIMKSDYPRKLRLPYPQTSAPGREEELSERSLWAVRVKDRAEQPLKPIRSKHRAHEEGESRMSSREINNNLKKNLTLLRKHRRHFSPCCEDLQWHADRIPRESTSSITMQHCTCWYY